MFRAMRKLPEVEEAKSLMKEAMDWSVFKWLFEKSRVRETADQANAALDKLNRSVKARWSSEIKAAYKELALKATHSDRHQSGERASPANDWIRLFAEQVKQADEAAHHARMTAENTFDRAEREMNTDLAREGCKQAIYSWVLHEKAIRIAESVLESAKTKP